MRFRPLSGLRQLNRHPLTIPSTRHSPRIVRGDAKRDRHALNLIGGRRPQCDHIGGQQLAWSDTLTASYANVRAVSNRIGDILSLRTPRACWS
jgi:hypothetical protein